MSYNAFVLIAEGCDEPVEHMHAVLKKGKLIRLDDSHYQCTDNGFSFYIALTQGDLIAQEADEIIASAEDLPKEVRLFTNASRRFEITSDFDENMDFFNEFIFLVEAFASNKYFIVYELASGDLITNNS